ncbi:hypothetical protein AAVH_10702 [Aphelenchoides avenae]|nr:hypothetical protein AAVH_10702 [Aphelenchus avenae]
MFHVGVALLVLLVPSVLPCGEKVGNLRAAILPQDPETGRGHIHVVVFGKVYSSPICQRIPAPPLKVTLEVGDRFVKPGNYKLLSNATLGAGYAVDFALSGDYSYDMFVLCPPAQPRVTVENSCGKTALDDIKPVYDRELGSKKRLLKVYDLGQISLGPPYGK